MNAGALTETISIWRNYGTKNAYGELQDVWRMQYQVRAAVTMQNSKKALANGEVWYPRAAVFRVRLGISPELGDRIQYEGNYYDVVSIVKDKYKEQCITINADLHNE